MFELEELFYKIFNDHDQDAVEKAIDLIYEAETYLDETADRFGLTEMYKQEIVKYNAETINRG